MEESEQSRGTLFKTLSSIFLLLVFGMIIVGVIFVALGMDIGQEWNSMTQDIPFLSFFGSGEEKQTNQLQDLLEESEARNEEHLQEITLLGNENEQLQEELQELEAELSDVYDELASTQQDEEEREQHLTDLASVYAQMSPTRAAERLENLSVSEAALLLEQMNQNDQSGVLARMTPSFAANVTVALKDFESVADADRAALQDRIQLLTEAMDDGIQTRISTQQMVDTISQMNVDRAAAMLEEMAEGQDRALGLRILSQLKDSKRSELLSQMDSQVATDYVRNLVEE